GPTPDHQGDPRSVGRQPQVPVGADTTGKTLEGPISIEPGEVRLGTAGEAGRVEQRPRRRQGDVGRTILRVVAYAGQQDLGLAPESESRRVEADSVESAAANEQEVARSGIAGITPALEHHPTLSGSGSHGV